MGAHDYYNDLRPAPIKAPRRRAYSGVLAPVRRKGIGDRIINLVGDFVDFAHARLSSVGREYAADLERAIAANDEGALRDLIDRLHTDDSIPALVRGEAIRRLEEIGISLRRYRPDDDDPGYHD